MAVFLPSGVRAGEYSTRVREGGQEFEVHVKWPLPLCNDEMLHRKWLRSEEDRLEGYHPKLLGFENALKEYREKRADSVKSVVRIASPFAVETHIVRRSPLGWAENAARMIYNDMKAYEESYGVEQNGADFEIC